MTDLEIEERSELSSAAKSDISQIAAGSSTSPASLLSIPLLILYASASHFRQLRLQLLNFDWVGHFRQLRLQLLILLGELSLRYLATNF
jgi:hypothetical protein